MSCGGSGIVANTSGEILRVKKDLRCYGDASNPIHASALPNIIKCNWSAALMFLFADEYESSEAADTGSATHVAVAEWHRSKEVKAAIEAMRDNSAKYPKANLTEAANMFLLYQADPRNKEAEIASHNGKLLIEQRITITIAPAQDDPSPEKEIVIVGTLDQVRVGVDGRPSVWDLKTSKWAGNVLMNMYFYQLGAYALGASSLMNKPVKLGGLITPRHYTQEKTPEKSPIGIFWNYPNRFHDLEHVLNGIRHSVAQIRSGMVWPSPSDQCKYCPGRGTEECVPLLGSIMDPMTKRIALKIA